MEIMRKYKVEKKVMNTFDDLNAKILLLVILIWDLKLFIIFFIFGLSFFKCFIEEYYEPCKT